MSRIRIQRTYQSIRTGHIMSYHFRGVPSAQVDSISNITKWGKGKKEKSVKNTVHTFLVDLIHVIS